MVDLKAELERKLRALYQVALEFMSEEEVHDLFRSVIPKRGVGQRGPDLHGRGGKPRSTSKEALRKRRSREARETRGVSIEIERELTEADLRESEQSIIDRMNSIADNK
jgi:hypothetical protein